jgi:hypothetical protein
MKRLTISLRAYRERGNELRHGTGTSKPTGRKLKLTYAASDSSLRFSESRPLQTSIYVSTWRDK